MRLQDEPFQRIKSGEKRIEVRLYDEKRQDISVGDEIEFIHVSNGQSIFCVVKDLHLFSSFAELYQTLPLLQCGYTAENVATASYRDMERYYPQEEQQRYGVVGIEIQLLSI